WAAKRAQLFHEVFVALFHEVFSCPTRQGGGLSPRPHAAVGAFYPTPTGLRASRALPQQVGPSASKPTTMMPPSPSRTTTTPNWRSRVRLRCPACGETNHAPPSSTTKVPPGRMRGG